MEKHKSRCCFALQKNSLAGQGGRNNPNMEGQLASSSKWAQGMHGHILEFLMIWQQLINSFFHPTVSAWNEDLIDEIFLPF